MLIFANLSLYPQAAVALPLRLSTVTNEQADEEFINGGVNPVFRA